MLNVRFQVFANYLLADSQHPTRFFFFSFFFFGTCDLRRTADLQIGRHFQKVQNSTFCP
jgi:hypothetical protein